MSVSDQTNLLPRGSLIRYKAAAGRWHLGLVRHANGDSVEVEFFWGADQTVPLDRIKLFRDYLALRKRVLSLTRADLCSAFFNNPLFRLREDRVKKIHATLHQHGFDFQPTHWPSPETRVQISLDDSVVSGCTSKKDAQFEALLPRWLQPQKLPPGSRDPLGFQVHAERLANELLPGLGLPP